MAEDDRDPKLSQRYRELGQVEPRHEIDAAILAAARRVARMRPAPLVAPTGRRRWYFPVAAAAIIVLAIAVTIHVERQKPDFEDAVTEATPPAPPQAAKDDRNAKTEVPKPAAKRERRFAPEPAPAAPAQPTPTQPVPAAKPENREASRDRQAEPMAQAPAPAARGDIQSRAQAYLVEPPERWLERIAALRRQGRDKEAEESLAEFRKRFPDYRIPEAMLKEVEKK